VAFTAQEVLQKLAREKGIKLSSELKMRTVAMPESSAIKEEKIPIFNAKDTMPGKAKNALSKKASAASADSAKTIKTTSRLAPSGKPLLAPASTAGDSAKVTSVKKAPKSDSLKEKTQTAPANAQDDVWGVQTLDSSKTAADKNVPSQPAAVDTAASKPAIGDTSSAAKPAGDIKKATGKQNVKKEKTVKKNKEKSAPPPPADEKNW
jgi:hypothetical protein